MRGDRLLDVVLVDAGRPAQLAPALGRVPELVIVAPPGGALGASGRAGLAALLGALGPAVVLGVGGEGLDDYMAGCAGALTRGLRGRLGSAPELSLRSLLVEGLRLYAMARWTRA
jgi:hypothetical protein